MQTNLKDFTGENIYVGIDAPEFDTVKTKKCDSST